MEKWILHKLNNAAEEINKHMTDRNFMMVTTSVYNFWLYELCDVFIVGFVIYLFTVDDYIYHSLFVTQEAMKPMTDESALITTRKSAQQTLYTCLDHGLRLLHPIMPFVTEELWQRLQRRPKDSTPSIMVSSYPTFVSIFNAFCFSVLTLDY